MDSQTAQHEFTPAQNEILKKAARWTGLFAWIMMISAGLMGLAGILSGEASSIGALIAAAIYFTIGLTFRGAASSMGEVVRTAGNDIDHLMTALDKLGSAFKVMALVVLVGAIASLAAIVSVWLWMSSLA
jgi:hypothetical protein